MGKNASNAVKPLQLQALLKHVVFKNTRLVHVKFENTQLERVKTR